MIEMGMREKMIRIHHAAIIERVAEQAKPGPGVEDQQPVAAAHFDAGGVSAVTGGGFARTGDAAADAPETHNEITLRHQGTPPFSLNAPPHIWKFSAVCTNPRRKESENAPTAGNRPAFCGRPLEADAISRREAAGRRSLR